ncbi:helix-turn-helix domain-containing protein [Cohnella herbarum]|uniref:AraC family transcriptional regulator n=1 Tax=Cohnella herbarum TaxID=2728023 RepID=A0A7Z2VK73_9BACL|nr:AraC family transcriptional regulator [Cohnella herbarum]QJD84526.1 AraC family transcriptional regulator [Cohnella herbarum]
MPDHALETEISLRSSLSLPSIRVLGDFVSKQGTGINERDIPDYEVLCFPEGSDSIYRINGQEYTLSHPCFILTRPGELHSYIYDKNKPTRHLFIHFWLRDFPADSLPLLMQNGPSVIPYEGEFLILLMKQIMAIAHAKPERLQERGSLLLLTLLAEIHSLVVDEPVAEATKRLPPQISTVLDTIDSSLSSDHTVERLAGLVGWTPEHLSRSFVRHLGLSTKEAIKRKRIDRACHLLLYGQKSIKEIAFEVGFADENYFCRVFKTAKAITATEYRVKHYNPRYGDLAPVNDRESPYPSNRVFFGEL